MKTHSDSSPAANRPPHSLVPLTAALLLLGPPLLATEAPLIPSLSFGSGLVGEQTLLTWDSAPGVRYRIQRSMDLGNGGWFERAMIEATGSKASWLDPEPTGGRGFYRMEPPKPEVFAVEPAVFSSTGGAFVLRAQCLPPSSSVVFEVDGQPPVIAALVPAGPGQWSASVVGGLVPGGAILSARVVNSGGTTVCVIDQTFEITSTGRASDIPPTLPPGAPMCSWSWGETNMGTNDFGGGHGSGKYSLGENNMGPRGLGGGHGAGKVSYSDLSVMISLEKASARRGAPVPGLPGEVRFEQCDLSLATPAGPPLRWVSTYRSRAFGGGGGASGWTSSFDIRIEPIPLAAGNNAPRLNLFNGDGQRNVLVRQPDGSYRCDGMFREGRFVGDSFHLTFADKGTWIFCPLVGAPWSGRIGSIVDRNGVALSCTYDGGGRLSSVASQFGQSISVAYDASGRLSTLTDQASRFVSFGYFGPGEPGGNPGDRKSVSCPQVAGSPPVTGPTTYTYSTGSPDPQLNGNLLSITDGAGQQVCSWTYSSVTDPLDVSYDTFATRLTARPSATVTIPLTSRIEPIPSGPASGGTLWIESDELGRVAETRYDRMHRPVSIRRYAGFAIPGIPVTSTTNRPPGSSKLRVADPDFYETTFTYNPDHQVVRAVAPNGSHHQVLYARELVTNCPVTQRGNPRAITLRAPGGEERTVSCDFLPGFGTPEPPPLGAAGLGKTIRDAWPSGRFYDDDASSARSRPTYDLKPGKGARMASWNLKEMKGARMSGGTSVWDGGDGDGGCTDGVQPATKSSSNIQNNFTPGGGGSIWDGGDGNGGCTDHVAIPNFIRLRKRAFNSSAESAGRAVGLGGYQAIAGDWNNDGIDTLGFASGEECDDGDCDDCDDYDARSIIPLGCGGGHGLAGPPSFCTRLATSLGQVFVWGYDLKGNRTAATTPILGSGYTCSWNSLGQCTSTTVLNGPGSSFRDECVYDASTHFLSSVIADKPVSGTGLQLTTTLGRDSLGRITSETDPRGFTCLCEYNPLDQVTRTQTPVVGTTAASRISTDYFYDAAGYCRRFDVEHKDPTGALVAANPAYSTFHVYDHGHLVRVATEERPVGPPPVPPILDPELLGIEHFATFDSLYDSAGQVVRMSTPAACRAQSTDLILEVVYDELAKPFRLIEGGASTAPPGGTESVTTQYDYDVLGGLVRCTLVVPPGTLSPTVTYTYDVFHRPASETDAMGNVTTYTYDNQGLTTVEVFGEVHDVSGSAGNVLLARGRGITTWPRRGITDSMNARRGITDSMDAWKWRGQARRGITDSMDAWKWRREAGRSSPGGGMPSVKRLLPAIQKIRESKNRFRPAFFDVFVADDVWTWERFAPGEPGPHATETTTVHRSPAGLPVSVTRNADTVLTCTHDTAARLASTSDGHVLVVVARDACGNETSRTRTDLSTLVGTPSKTFTCTCIIDPLGRTASVTGGGNVAARTLDSRGRVASYTAPGGLVTTCTYDGEDPLGAYSIILSADVDGDSILDELGRVLCRSGECRSVTDSHHSTTTFTNDALGRTTRCDFADGTFETCTFDPLGHAAQYQRKNGAIIACDFDYKGRATSRVWSNVPVPVIMVEPTILEYDGLDQMTHCEQGTSPFTSSVLTWTYDSVGNQTSESHNGHTLTRTFNIRGRTGIVYPDLTRFAEVRNAIGLLTSCSVVTGGGSIVSPPVVSLDYSGHRVSMSIQANGVFAIHAYRGDNDPPPPGGDDFSFDACVRSTITGPGAVVLSDTIIHRNHDQCVTQCDTGFSSAAGAPGRRKTFAFNRLNRVTRCDIVRREFTNGPIIPEKTVIYTLDLEGLRLSSATDGLPPVAYTQSSAIPPGDYQMSQYTTWSGGDLEWNDDNCLTTMTNGTVHFQCVYDAASRLRAIRDPATGADIATYVFDAMGRRARRNIWGTSPAETFFVWDSDECVQELGSDGVADMTFATGGTGFKHCISTRNGTLYYPSGGGSQSVNKISAITMRFGKCVATDSGSFRLITGGTGNPVDRLDCDDGGRPIFLTSDGHPRPGATSTISCALPGETSTNSGFQWLAPESAWCPESGFFQFPGGVYSPALGQVISTQKDKPKTSVFGKSHELTGHVTLMK